MGGIGIQSNRKLRNWNGLECGNAPAVPELESEPSDPLDSITGSARVCLAAMISYGTANVNTQMQCVFYYKLCLHVYQKARTSMARLCDRVVCIAGASRGLGAAMAIRCAEEGARVVLLDILACDETHTAVLNVNSKRADRVFTVKCDVADPVSCDKAAQV
jgi:hypothetical protein